MALKIVFWHKRKGWPKGVKRGPMPKSPEHCAAISAGLKGKKKAPESVAKMVASLTGRKLSDSHVKAVKEGMLRAGKEGKLSRDTRGDRNPRWIEDRDEAKIRKKLAMTYVDLVRNALFASKTETAHSLLGYSSRELRQHLESLFLPGVSWSNYGEWHVDHIRPINTFSRNTPVYLISSLRNLRPLWATDNLRRPKHGRDEAWS